MASLHCHGDTNCNKTQIIRNFHLYIIQFWKPFFHIFTHGDVINAQTWEVAPQKIQSSHLKYSKKLYFSKESCGTFCFLMPRLFWVALFQLNAIGYSVFRKSAKALIFVRLISRAEFCRGYTVWIAFAGFITFECIITFVANYYIVASTTPPPPPSPQIKARSKCI